MVEWERTTELARREAMQHAADVHGHGGASAAEAAKERSELVQAMMSQKANIMLLSTVSRFDALVGFSRVNDSCVLFCVATQRMRAVVFKWDGGSVSLEAGFVLCMRRGEQDTPKWVAWLWTHPWELLPYSTAGSDWYPGYCRTGM